MDDILGLDTYVIGRPLRFSLNVAYDCYDSAGSKLISVKHNMLGNNYSLLDSAGKTVGSMRQKLISLTPTYELYDGEKRLIGKVAMQLTVNISPFGSRKFVLEDGNGNKIAHLTLTSPLMGLGQLLEGQKVSALSGYDITGADESTVIAKINMQQSAPAWMGQSFVNFVLQIVDKSITTLLLIEFAIAVDHFSMSSYTSNQYGSPTFGGRGGFGGGGGMSGVNFKI